MKKQNAHIPFTKEELKAIGDDKLSLLFLYTGVRRFELNQLLNLKVEGKAIKLIGKGSKFRLVPVNKKISDLISSLKITWGWKSDRSINHHFEKIAKRVGFKVNPHRFRATFATKLINNGIDLVTIQTLMGHSNVSTTAGYIKINTVGLIAAVDQLTNPVYELEGMSPEEMKQEIIRLRKRIERDY